MASLTMGPVDPAGAQRAAWGATVGKTIALQWVVILLFAGVAWAWIGAGGAQSLLLGGAAVAVPNALLALWLTARLYRVGAVGVASMLAGEMLKLGMTIALLAVVGVALKPQIVWLALIVGVVAALKAQWLAVWFTRNS
ncbi:MAG: ATP synthase subunit I [Burkholderiales bacterium]